MQQNEATRQLDSPSYRAEDYYYTVSWSEEDEAFIGRVAEFPSLAAHGDSPQEALGEILLVVKGSLEDMEESGEPIPTPFGRRTYSGRLNVRMPEHLHRRLAIEAEQQRTSLNRWINAKLEAPIE